ncbi:hypothetical protein DEO72_LG10g2701 [Vigna unguiculata]|uniref:Uncharacterized protein n=1 Tax=Vigna unguiculata TaxID=3917 RepID=A0A4D6NDN9_VIGUN|nr:hypothetical protein DEO72_LG10g2701 [Vigna unguiculata]
MGNENVANDDVVIVGEEEKKVVIVECAEKWVKESASDMPHGGFMLAARRCCVATQAGCCTVTNHNEESLLVHVSDRLNERERCTEWRLAARCAPPGDEEKTVALKERWRPAVSGYRQAVWGNFAWWHVHGWWLTCDDMSGEVHIQILSREDTSEVRRAGLRAGSSPFLFVYGDDRVIRYTGANVDTGGAEDVQATEYLITYGWGRLTTMRSLSWSMLNERERCTEWRLAARCAPPGDEEKTVALKERWRPAVSGYRQAVWGNFAWWHVHGWWLTCDDMSGEVHIQILSREDTSEVRRAGLRAGSSPFLFVYGDDRVIRYTGANVDTGGAEDVQATE